MERRRMLGTMRCKATHAQLSYLAEYMKKHPTMASGICPDHKSRARHEHFWKILVHKLNSIGGPSGPMKTLSKWKQAWRDLRNNEKKKAISKSALPSDPVIIDAPSETRNDKFEVKVLVESDVDDSLGSSPPTPEPAETSTPLPQQTENMPQQRTPSPLRFRRRRFMTSFDEYPVSSSSIDKLERIENRYTEAMLEHARATDRLAAAIEKIADSFGQPQIVVLKTSNKSKKKRTQLILAQESDSDEAGG